MCLLRPTTAPGKVPCDRSKGRTDEARGKDACHDRLLGLMVRMARLTVALVVLAMWGCGAVRTVPRPATAASSPTRHVLANGIPVIVQEHRGSDVVALQLWVRAGARDETAAELGLADRKSTRLNSSHDQISYAVFCLKKKNN